MFKKLRIKFLTTLMVLFTVIIVGIFTTVYISSSQNGEYIIFTKLSEGLSSVKFGPSGTMDGKKNMFNNITFALYDNKNGELFYTNEENIDKEAVTSIVKAAIAGKEEKGFVNYNDHEFSYVFRITPRGTELAIQDSTYHKKTLERLIITLTILGGGSLVILYTLSLYIAKKVVEPVEAAYNSQKRFIADASHELKTPLAIINTNLSVIKNNEDKTIKSQEKWFEYISFQSDRMSKLINNLLYLAKADNNEPLGTVTNFNISDTIMNQLLSFEGIMFENKLTLETNIKEDIWFCGDKEKINQLVGILLDNAIKHSHENKEIVVSLKEKKQRIFLSVTNYGDTIPSEDIDKIFHRFYRVDKARAREGGGYGLGLSIAKSIVEEYKGKIWAKSENNRTSFNVEITSNVLSK